ncbi:hypothetical protein ACFOY4_37380 [Actinomadura syzygii]|uniref:listeriolysin S family toxin n=1 Tax=Actinomadura syzygii TaxID=1427538 RepID=UPI00165203C8|nr:listeriolysin S family toxin [Actinomadura syzygii]
MSMSIEDLQSLPEEQSSLLHGDADLACCTYTCGTQSCGATCSPGKTIGPRTSTSTTLY